MSHPTGIALSRSGATWVSVSNPHRDDSVAEQRWSQVQDSAGLDVGRAGGIGVASGAAVAVLCLLLGLPALAAGVVALAVVVGAWIEAARWLRTRRESAQLAQQDSARSWGPRRILRGSLVDGPLADAADDVVMASAAILQSDAARAGALGDPSDVYRDLMESTWALLWRCSVLDADQHQYARTFMAAADRVDPAEMDVEVDYLRAEHAAATADLAPLIDEHLRLAATVADLDHQMSIPAARQSLQQLASSRAADPSPSAGHQSLEARVSAAHTVVEASRSGSAAADEDQSDDVRPTLDSPHTRQEP